MKKILTILALSSMIAACGRSGNNSQSANDSTDVANSGAAAHQSEAVQETTVTNTGAERTTSGVSTPTDPGAQLIAKSDCLSCHKEHDKLVGPPYADVAKRYKAPDDIDKLAEKVIKGGAGSWGDVPMTAHPNLSLDDAKKMVAYVLSVK